MAAGEPAAVRQSLGASNTVEGVKGRTLGLQRVTIPSGAEIALHHHTGTQVAHVDEGTLTYTVKAGGVKVMSGTPDAKPKVVRSIKAGQTGQIRAGQWIVEQPSTIHRAANKGSRKVVIYLATLLPKGDPPSVPNQP